MEVGDLFEVFVALGVLLLGALSGGRKKKPPPQRRAPFPQPAPRRAPAARPPVTTAEQVAEMLRRRLEQARGEMTDDLPEAYSLEGTSLETLEAAGGASHKRFHDRYVSALPELTSPVVHPRLPVGGLRQAVVWSEILAPPKALRED